MNPNTKKAVKLSSMLLPFILGIYGGNVLADSHNHKSSAKTCYVDHIKYTNKGAYSVNGFTFHYVRDGETVKHYFETGAHDVNLDNGQSKTVNLNNYLNTFAWDGGYQSNAFVSGSEVWLQIEIAGGENKSCHKDNHKLVYKKDVGKTMKFKSGGETFTNNSCKYNGDMDNDCYTGP